MITEVLLVLVLLTVLLSLGATRLTARARIMAFQGILVSLIPALLKGTAVLEMSSLFFYALMIGIKGILIPSLLFWAIRRVGVKREIEPIIGYHASILAGLIMLLASVLIAGYIRPSLPEGNGIVLITAITTMAAGFFLMMGRAKAITQVIGYLMLENGIYLIGTALTKHAHNLYVVEFGVLLDLLVGVMIMGIILNNINKAFDDIDTTLLGQLKD